TERDRRDRPARGRAAGRSPGAGAVRREEDLRAHGPGRQGAEGAAWRRRRGHGMRRDGALPQAFAGRAAHPGGRADPGCGDDGNRTRAPRLGSLRETPVTPPRNLGELFMGFLWIGARSFGGVLPWAYRTMVEERRWMTHAD